MTAPLLHDSNNKSSSNSSAWDLSDQTFILWSWTVGEMKLQVQGTKPPSHEGGKLEVVPTVATVLAVLLI